MKLNNFVDRIFVISLKDSKRRNYIKKTLNRYDIDFSFFDAVDGRNQDLSYFEKKGWYSPTKEKYSHNFGMPHSAVETLSKMMACSLSHVMVAKKILEEGIEKALILEDDIEINYSNMQMIDELYKYLPKNWDLIYLGYFSNDKTKFFNSLKYKTYSALHALGLYDYVFFGKNYNPINHNKYYYKAGVFPGSHAYISSNKLASLICTLHFPVYAPPDEFLDKIYH
jgi:glycosyl transferase family 25